MYADREEARSRRKQTTSPELEIEKRPKRDSSQSIDDSRVREKELQEQLRSRALASRTSRDSERGRRRSGSRSPRSRDSSPAQRARPTSPSRSRSRDSHRSRKSHISRNGSYRADNDRDERRKRRREERDGYESRSRRRDPDPEEEEDRNRERRRRRSERDDRDADYRSSRREADTYNGTANRYDRDRYSSYHDDRDRNYDRYHRDYPRRRDPFDDDRRPSRRSRYDSPSLSVRSHRSHRSHRSPTPPTAETEEYEERSAFCSQLAARLEQRDLGVFFEEHLGEGSVNDVRIVMDKVTHRSKGVGYVEFADKELVSKAIDLSGKVLFGIPILVQKTDAARNREQTSTDTQHRPNLAQANHGLPGLDPKMVASLPLPPQYQAAISGAPIHLNVGNLARQPQRPGPNHPNMAARLYVGSLHFSLTDENVKSVFEPFGEIDYVDLHREPGTGKSKGFAFVQFKEPEDARKALEQMNGFEIAGRAIRVGNVNAKGSGPGNFQSPMNGSNANAAGGNLPTLTSSFDEGGGAGLNPEKRAALMEKLASRNEPTSPVAPQAQEQERPSSIPEAVSTSLLLKNMFTPEDETEPDWEKDLAEDVKIECQTKYGVVTDIYIEKESAGEIYITFAEVDSSKKAMAGLNGRWFGGKPISAHYVPDAFVKAKLG